MYFIEQMSHVAAAAHAPFISAASPELFGLETYTDLGKPRDLAKVFDTVDYAKWRSFRDSEDSRYVGLTVPRFLGRLPFNPKDGTATEGFNFVEDVDGTDHDKYLWVNAAYAMGARLTAAFENYGWCAAIRGVEGGGLVEDLPTHTFKTDEGEVALKCPTEIAITDRREKELSDLGFIPLVHCKNTDYAAFFGTQSTQRAKKYDSDAANANAVLSAQLQYMFSVCRIAHYLKAMMRDKVGSFASAANIEEFLSRWIRQYVVEDDNATQETKATYRCARPASRFPKCRAARHLPRRVVHPAAFPARRAFRVPSSRRRAAAVPEGLNTTAVITRSDNNHEGHLRQVRRRQRTGRRQYRPEARRKSRSPRSSTTCANPSRPAPRPPAATPPSAPSTAKWSSPRTSTRPRPS
jgi:type VI secretion system protein ImpC